MVLDITDASPDRVASGLEMIRSGGRIRFHDIYVGGPSQHTVRVGINTSWLPDNLTEASALAEFHVAESQYSALLHQHPEVGSILSGHDVVYELLYDYRLAAVLLGSYDGQRITWSSPYSPKT